ncbi:uncharacterized protein LOC116806246 isoform X2 [Drosophila grimshawi]|uniref:uncharacterized protein LOC116806246 isoform X2 n=1 Tax=Drosophila grimshawi TaxID=7222 RepID=UPI000C871542|nr:uncharacterized protein LOC116806246 isoform X2 [Drosophila grimshawi]
MAADPSLHSRSKDCRSASSDSSMSWSSWHCSAARPESRVCSSVSGRLSSSGVGGGSIILWIWIGWSRISGSRASLEHLLTFGFQGECFCSCPFLLCETDQRGQLGLAFSGL